MPGRDPGGAVATLIMGIGGSVLGSGVLRLQRKTLAMFMGSKIGNYEPAQAKAILKLLAGVLRPGDGLLLGTDLKKSRETLELAYDDPAGVTWNPCAIKGVRSSSRAVSRL